MADASEGWFGWKRRMGVHYAYHQRRSNRIVHHLCIPVELLAITTLLANFPAVWGVPAAVIAMGLMGAVYVLVEPLAGMLMVASLWGLYQVGLWLVAWVGLWTIPLAVAAFLLMFNIQMGWGHVRLEPGTEVEGDLNFKEFFETRNPIPLTLIFYYHLIELLMLMGYRPALRAEISRHMHATLVCLRLPIHPEAWPKDM